MVSDKRTGIQIRNTSIQKDISIVGGGIKIEASQKPIATNFTANEGWIYI